MGIADNACTRPKPTVRVEGVSCSVGRQAGRNDDYALFVPGVGACVADGMGGAPLGDAIARYACHVAMRALCDGGDVVGALGKARDGVEEFIRTVDAPSSGASVMVLELCEPDVKVAWMGDVALFAYIRSGDKKRLVSTLTEGEAHMRPLGISVHDGPGIMTIPMEDVDRAAVCTDGVWRKHGRIGLDRILESAGSTREAAAKLVFEGERFDDATALVLSFERERGL